jgi:hypothetical protein
MTDDPRLHSPAAERNRGPILAQLQRLLPARAMLIEVASGTGQHAAHCAAAMPGWRWQPTELQPEARASIEAWCAGLLNVSPAVRLDVCEAGWSSLPDAVRRVDAVYCANMLHIAPWDCCAGLMQGAAARLVDGGLLLVYGPFLIDGETPAPSNLAFDADLRSRDPAWGLRRLEAVAAVAAEQGLELRQVVEMPANNRLLVFGR